MRTYNDLVEERDKDLTGFIQRCINEHQSSELYLMAVVANEYARQQNTTIMQYQKLLYTMSGKVVPDNFSANYKLCSNFFDRFITQQVQYLLGNGVSWGDIGTGEKLGSDFDEKLQKAGKESLIGAVSFGFWNLDHVEVFNVREFVPLYDEENGALRAGIRFWQIDPKKPLRVTLYEEDGYTEFRKEGSVWEVLQEKRPYVVTYQGTDADGLEIFDGRNYPSFPIVPLFGNSYKQSELVGLQEEIDAYDLIKSGFANDLDDASQIYWIIQNAGGMDDVDLAKFVDRIKTVHAATVEDDGAQAEAHTLEVPYNARESLLERLRKDLYEDYMALDVANIAGGAATATQIKAAYEPMNNKADEFEFQVRKFVDSILELAGIDDQYSFTRSTIINSTEEISTVLSAAQYLTEDYVTTKILTILGDGDKAEDMLKQMDADELDRGGVIGSENKEVEENDNV